MQISNLFTKKQQQVLSECWNNRKWKLMINYGAARAGKTFVDNFVFLYEVRHAAEIAKRENVRHPMYILAGVSSKSIANNVLNEIANTFGLTFKFDKHNSFTFEFPGLPAVKIVQTFTGSISGLGAIRGMTSFGAYVNEASLANQSVFEEIRVRCSAPDARVVCDTNPDTPTHWLKVDYIDKAKNDDNIICNHFVMDDNTTLDPAYVASQKSTTPSGMFYDRRILGLWVAGEGLVYQDFDKAKNVISLDDFHKRTANQSLSYYCGLDWGYEHKGVIVVLADDENNNTYLIEEHTAKHRDIEYWVKVAKSIRAKYGWTIPIYCDSARPEYVQRLIDENFNAMNGYKSRLVGVENCATKIKERKFMLIEEANDKFLDEIYQYTWDEKTGMPAKVNDDVMDAFRYAIATRKWELENKQTDNRVEQTRIVTDAGLVNPAYGDYDMGLPQ